MYYKSVKSEYVVKLLNHFRVGTLLYSYVMPLMGDNLFEIIRKTKMTYAFMLKIAKDICCGVRDLHAGCLIHRDLKP